MNVLTLKGEILQMVSAVHNEQLLLRLKDAFIQLQEEDAVKLDTLLSEEQIDSLEQSIAESYRDEDVMEISEAKQMHARWLKR
jgi:hypothetical protein